MAEIIYDEAGRAIAQIVDIGGKLTRQPPPPESVDRRQRLKDAISKSRTIAELKACLIELLEKGEQD